MSASKDDEYFSEGMTDEIIGDLSKINGLRIARADFAVIYR
jgi:TolB-like protein